jgi:predicted CXXCH cytochrome family protein
MAAGRPYQRRRSRRPPAIRLPWAVWAVLGALVFVAGTGFTTGAYLEEHDDFCASCHTQPESAYFQRTQAAAVADLASKHHTAAATLCIDCHSGPGFTGRVGAMALGAKDLAAFVTRTDQQPAPLTVPIADADCLKCHGDVPSKGGFNRHFHTFLTRWQASDANAATCVDCHSAHTTDGDPGLAYLEQQRTQNICESCHAALGARG